MKLYTIVLIFFGFFSLFQINAMENNEMSDTRPSFGERFEYLVSKVPDSITATHYELVELKNEFMHLSDEACDNDEVNISLKCLAQAGKIGLRLNTNYRMKK